MDEQRTETSEEREQFHLGFVSLFTEYNIPYYLVSGTMEERIERIDSVTG